MANSIRWGLDNPYPFTQMKTELIWEGKYDEYGNRRTVDIAGLSDRILQGGAAAQSHGIVAWT